MADEAMDKIGALMEQLGARFELVVEAVSGWGNRLDSFRDEMRGQINELGKQIRFISEQIALNRQGANSIKAKYNGPECTRARTLKSLGHTKEAESWALACIAKGGTP